MRRRTTVELDEELLARARQTLGCRTMRETIEEALRRATAEAQGEAERRRRAQLGYLDELSSLVDVEVLASDEMWR